MPSGRAMVDSSSSSEARGVPQNLEAERSVLGALLLHADAVCDVQFLRPADFYLPKHQIIFQSILAAFNPRQVTDPIVVAEELHRQNMLTEVGGREHLLDLLESVVSAAGVVFHAEIVREKAVQRRLLETCVDVARRCYENQGDARELLDEAERQIFEIARLDKTGEAVSIADILQQTFTRIEKLRERGARVTGLATDYLDLDDMMGGLQPGELIVVAARPSMGKTSFALNLTERVGGQNLGVGFFSLEMSNQQVIQNMLCCRAQIDGQALRKG